MPRNGSGTYQLPAGNPVVTGTTISSSGWANPTLADIASALTASIAVDGQTVPTANLPMGNFRHVNVSSGQATNEYASVGQIQNAGLPLLSGAPPTTMTVTGLVINEPASGTTTLTVNAASDPNGANIKLAGNGALTPNKFIRSFNGSLNVLNSAYSASILTLDDNGNLVVNGDVRGLSDERIKDDWGSLPLDFVYKLANVIHGTFTRTDTGARQVGVSAQSFRELLPEAVSGDDVLSVAYGNAALVSAIQLAIELLKLRDRVAALEGA
ncbi:tail fiber domain-containing protein [Burkholderia multivorans]|uniref:tail fiber domain-containing protein n=1 Tax=Burkholderia multivorans TaxID=87883 RepID=UPI0011B23DA0|nr:tail fiber domain-containing protein [Burkholderia multivorans]